MRKWYADYARETTGWEKISALARDSAAKAAVLSSAVRINAKIIVLTLFGVVFVII